MEKTRTLSVDLCIDDNGDFVIEIIEGESGENITYGPYTYPDENKEAKEKVGMEILSWIELMADEIERED